MVTRLVFLAVLACAGASGPARAQATTTPAAPTVMPADIRFMQEMIGHHQQAIEMTALVATRTRRPQLRVLAERITVSQSDEISMMRQWLRKQGASDSTMTHDMSGHAGHGMHDMPAMPGMLSAGQMTALKTARGGRFDRLFLEGMIRHHQGALTMVRRLLDEGAAQESSINRFVTDVDTDQRAEISRMRRLLSELH